jgi:hypothetical protein
MSSYPATSINVLLPSLSGGDPAFKALVLRSWSSGRQPSEATLTSPRPPIFIMEASIVTVSAPAPVPTGLSTLPATDFWNETQWAVFMSLMDAALPAIGPKSAVQDSRIRVQIPDRELDALFERLANTVADPPSKEDFTAYLGERCVDDVAFVETCKRNVCSLPPSTLKELGGLCTMLSYV